MGGLTRIIAVLALFSYGCCQVLELSDRFLDGGTPDQPWLIMFYAPWCGHCKHLKPVFESVARSLKSSGIHVGKVDATRFNEAARTYNIRGFPTIKFIRGSEVTEFHNERTAEAIAKFAVRSNSPAFRPLQSGRLPDNLGDDAVSFVYVGPETHPLYTAFTSLAVKNRLDAFFFTSPVLPLGFPSDRKSKDAPSVFVVKEPNIIKQFHDSDAPSSAASASLSTWVEAERWPRLMEVSAVALRQLADLEKVAVIAVVEKSKEGDNQHHVNKLLKDSLRLLTEESTYLDDIDTKVQLGFTHDLTLISSITIGYVTPPSVIALEAKTSKYSVAPIDEEKLLSAAKSEKGKKEVFDALKSFVDDVEEDKVELYGGRGWMISIRRFLHEILSTIIAVWMESPLLGALVFGLPTLVISFIVYMLCCMETVDGPDLDALEDDEWDSEDEYAGGLEAGDGAHLEGAWRQQDGAFLEGGLADEGGGGDVGMKLRKRIGIDEDTTWDDVLRENVPPKP